MHVIKEGITSTLKIKKLYHLLYNHYQKALLRGNKNYWVLIGKFRFDFFFKAQNITTEIPINTFMHIQQKSSRLCILQYFVTTIEKQKIGYSTIIKIKHSNQVIHCQT